MLKISQDGVFHINIPESVCRGDNLRNEVALVKIDLIKGKRWNRSCLIDAMMECFWAYQKHPEFSPSIRFYISIDNDRYILDADIKTSYARYLFKLAKSD